ncbi:hypothetical protein GCM10010232_48900 [Streptomyces amakusaensis]|uniref:Uncharacterized protein n=1 Tax=Streptomyces amakusaensis TaxID=67271 RepID=A0ABW0AKQ7_9ACTN
MPALLVPPAPLPDALPPDAAVREALQHLTATSGPVPVGPEWEAVLLPADLARRAVDDLARRAAPLGAVFTDGPVWGFVVPPRSGTPVWPDGADYRAAGTRVTLPAPAARVATGATAGCWVRRPFPGRILTAPLLPHQLATALSTEPEAAA